MRCILFFIGLLLLPSILFAQQNQILQNNPALKWYRINTPHFKILYPRGFENQAMHMANLMEHIQEPEARTMGGRPGPRTSIILQNQTAVSNAFVSITPRRSELFTMPSQNYNFIGNNDWLKLLATHEYRHIAQYNHANRGFNRLLFYLFGYNTLSGMSYVSVPPWFWEGDAVATETAFTPSGRGRIPNFDLVFKTNLLEGRKFNYDKQFLRSYKHNIPDHYVLGYHMVSYLRKRTGNADAWENITRRAWSWPFLPFTFSRSIQRETGLSVKELYREMASSNEQLWQAQMDTTTLTALQSKTVRRSAVYTDYRYPADIGKDSILVMRSGIGDIEQFMIMQGNKLKRLFTPGPINNAGMLSVANNKIVWNEFRYDPRRRMRSYSVIMTYDIKKRTARQLTRQTRYASAALSVDGKKVVTVESDVDYRTNLVVLDYETGSVLKKFAMPDDEFITMPRWSTDGSEIIAFITDAAGKHLSVIDYETGQVNKWIFFGDENAGHPVPYKNYIFYNSPRTGIDNIYAINRTTGIRYQVTSARYGAYNPSISADGQRIFYNDQQKDGLDAVSIPFNPASWKPVRILDKQPDTFYAHLVEQEARPHMLDSVPARQYPVKRFSQVANMLNIYSWGAYVNSSELTEVSAGIFSQDVLSTTSANAGLVYDLNERTTTWKAGITYQRWFPVIDFQYSQAARVANLDSIKYRKIIGKDTIGTKDLLKFYWDEKTIEAGFRLPLLTTSSRYIGNFTLFNYLGYTSVKNFRNSLDDGGRLLPVNYPQYLFRDYIDKGTLLYNRFNLSAYRLLKQNRRDINSKWGQAIFINAYNTPFGGDYSGSLFSFQGRMYFPGLFRHHSLWGYWAYQQSEIADVFLSSGKGLDNYTFRNTIPLPRGQSVSRFEKFYSMSVNYTLPVWYPDVHLGPLVNVQRMRANFFYDYGYGNSLINNRPFEAIYSTIGAEVKFDINVIRLLPQLDIGFRYSYRLNSLVQPNQPFELLIGTFNF
jgi:hypothetical protein